MKAMVQSVNSCRISPARQKAEILLHPAKSFKEALRKQSGAKNRGQRAEGPLHPTESFKPVHQKQKHSVVEKESMDLGQGTGSTPQPVAQQENKDPEPGKVEAAEAQLPGQPLNQDARVMQNPQTPFIGLLPEMVENAEENILPFLTAQAKADASAAATSVRQDIPNISHLKERELPADPKNIWNEGMALPEGQKKSLFATETTFQHTPWAMGNEAPRSDPFKSEFNGNLSGQQMTLPGSSTDSPTLLGFDEKLDILLGQNSTGEEVAGQSLNDEFTGFGSPASEKNGAKAVAGGENHPAKDPFGLNELFGSLKPSTVAEENGIQQKPPLSKTEHPGLYQQIAEKVIWSIRNNQEKIRLTLEPPQLGNLFIELHRNKEEIKATLWADNSKTKEILENNQFQLQKALEGHGFKLEQYEVFVQQDMGSFPGKEENPVFRGPGSRAQSLQMEEAELLPAPEILPGAIPASGASQYIDRFV